jgi:hypothetical protein
MWLSDSLVPTFSHRISKVIVCEAVGQLFDWHGHGEQSANGWSSGIHPVDSLCRYWLNVAERRIIRLTPKGTGHAAKLERNFGNARSRFRRKFKDESSEDAVGKKFLGCLFQRFSDHAAKDCLIRKAGYKNSDGKGGYIDLLWKERSSSSTSLAGKI